MATTVIAQLVYHSFPVSWSTSRGEWSKKFYNTHIYATPSVRLGVPLTLWRTRTFMLLVSSCESARWCLCLWLTNQPFKLNLWHQKTVFKVFPRQYQWLDKDVNSLSRITDKPRADINAHHRGGYVLRLCTEPTQKYKSAFGNVPCASTPWDHAAPSWGISSLFSLLGQLHLYLRLDFLPVHLDLKR